MTLLLVAPAILPGIALELETAGNRVANAVAAYRMELELRGPRVALASAHNVMQLVGITTFLWIWLASYPALFWLQGRLIPG